MYILNTWKYLFITMFILVAPCEIWSQEVQEKAEKKLFQGLFIGTDLFAPGSYIVGTDYVSYQLSLQANLKNKFFPVWEIGMGKGNTTTELALDLKTKNALYNRIGLNYNILSEDKEDFIFLGVRYGFSSFDFSIQNITLNGGYWGEDYIGNSGAQSATVTWGEFLAGIQVGIVSNLYMGWSVGYKVKITEKTDHKDLTPWYIPGYGTSNWGISYHVFYKIPFFN